MRRDKINILTIETPEGIAFSLKLAGPVTRFLAWSVDLAVIAAASAILNKVLMIFGVISHDIATAFSILLYFAVSIGYGIVMEWYRQGRTLGKQLLNLRVMDLYGLRLEFSQIVIRNLLRFVDGLPAFYLVGGVAGLISSRAQRLGDLAANTIVVWTPKIPEPSLDNILSGKFNSFREYPHLTARLRQRISPIEADIALRALLRRDDLNPRARVALFRDIADYFKSSIAFPPEATDGISNEQYIRNVVDILYRTKAIQPSNTKGD